MNKKLLAGFLCFVFLTLPVTAGNIYQEVRKTALLVKAKASEGSGTVFISYKDGKKRTFILTAYHVIDHMWDKKTKKFKTCKIRKLIHKQAKHLGAIEAPVSVFRYSKQYDLAILELKKEIPILKSAVAVVDSSRFVVGTEVIHIGSPWGSAHQESVYPAIITGTERKVKLNPLVPFGQLSIPVDPGCSGGGVYLRKNKKFIGMVTSKVGHASFYIPIRTILKWAKKEKILWIFNPKKSKTKKKKFY